MLSDELFAAIERVVARRDAALNSKSKLDVIQKEFCNTIEGKADFHVERPDFRV